MARAAPETAPLAGGWPAPRLHALQVAELYRFAGAATGFSFFAALLTLGVLVEIGDTARGSAWFVLAAFVTLLRAFLLVAYSRRTGGLEAATWGRLMIAANLLAGVQWGIAGTVLFPAGPLYAQLFMLMMIICLVAGSVTAYAPLAGAHEALSIPAAVPSVAYLFFLHDGAHWYAGAAGLFFTFAIVYYARKLHDHVRRTLALRLERDDLLALADSLNEKLAGEKMELAHRAAVRGASMESARDEARRLAALFAASPLPQLECDASGRIVASNAAAERVLGRSGKDLAGQPLAGVVAARGARPASFPHVRRAGALDVEVRGAGGSVLFCEAALTPLPGPAGAPGGFAVALVGLGVPVAT